MMINTHKNGTKVRVLVDVHVAEINQQRHHAVEEADNGHAHKELRCRGCVSHHERRSERVVTNSRVSLNQWDLA